MYLIGKLLQVSNTYKRVEPIAKGGIEELEQWDVTFLLKAHFRIGSSRNAGF
jgi:hypothetical protein